MNPFKKLKAYLRFHEAVRKAEEAHARTGARYYVIPASKGILLVTDRKNFRQMKQKGYIKRGITVANLIAYSFYYTPYRGGSQPIEATYAAEKKKSYYRWYERENKRQTTKKGAK